MKLLYKSGNWIIAKDNGVNFSATAEDTRYLISNNSDIVTLFANRFTRPQEIDIAIADIPNFEDLTATKYTEVTFFEFLHNNTGSSSPITIDDNNIVYINEPSDIFNKSLDPSKSYIVTRIFPYSNTDNIWIGEGGLTITGYGDRISGFICTDDNSDLFIVDPNGTYSGALIPDKFFVETSGVNSRALNLDNKEQTDNTNNQLDLTKINFVNCTEIGVLKGYRQLFWDIGSSIFSGSLTLDDVWSGGARITSNRTLNGTNTSFLKAGTNLIMKGRFITDVFYTATNPNAVVCDFSPSNIENDADFQVIRGDFGGAVTTLAGHFPNMPISSTKAFFDSQGIEKTNVGGKLTWTTEAETTISVAGDWVTASGTTTLSNAQWTDSPNNNELRYLSTQIISGSVEAFITLDGGTGDVLGARLMRFDSSLSAPFELDRTRGEVPLFGTIGLNLRGDSEINENDYVYLEIRNESDTTNVTVLNDSKIILSRR